MQPSCVCMLALDVICRSILGEGERDRLPAPRLAFGFTATCSALSFASIFVISGLLPLPYLLVILFCLDRGKSGGIDARVLMKCRAIREIRIHRRNQTLLPDPPPTTEHPKRSKGDEIHRPERTLCLSEEDLPEASPSSEPSRPPPVLLSLGVSAH